MAKEELEDYIYINKVYLKLIGLWPYENNDKLLTIYLHKFRLLVFSSLLWIFFFVPLILDVYIVWGNSYAIFQNMSMTVHVFSVCLKFTYVASNQANFKVQILYYAIPLLLFYWKNIAIVISSIFCRNCWK